MDFPLYIFIIKLGFHPIILQWIGIKTRFCGGGGSDAKCLRFVFVGVDVVAVRCGRAPPPPPAIIVRRFKRFCHPFGYDRPISFRSFPSVRAPPANFRAPVPLSCFSFVAVLAFPSLYVSFESVLVESSLRLSCLSYPTAAVVLVRSIASTLIQPSVYLCCRLKWIGIKAADINSMESNHIIASMRIALAHSSIFFK